MAVNRPKSYFSGLFCFYFAVSDYESSDFDDFVVRDCYNTDYGVIVILRENGVANEGNRTIQLQLDLTIPPAPDPFEAVIHQNISLTILDLDSKHAVHVL